MDRYTQLKDRLPLFVMAEWVGGINTGQATSLEDAGPDPIFHPRGLVCTYIWQNGQSTDAIRAGYVIISWAQIQVDIVIPAAKRSNQLQGYVFSFLHPDPASISYESMILTLSMCPLLPELNTILPPPCFPSPRFSTSDNKDISIWLRREEEKKRKQTHSKM